MGVLPSTRQFKVVGIWSTNTGAGRFLALTHYTDAKRLARKPKDEVPQFRLYLQEPFALEKVKQAIESAYPQQFDMVTWQRIFGQQFAAVKMEKRMMAVLLSLIIMVAIFNIVSALVMMVHSKTADIAILKTLGMSSNAVMAIFMCQGMLSGVLGLLLGIGIGAGVTFNFDALIKTLHVFALPPGMSIPIELDPFQVLGIVLGTLLTTFLATWYPARRAASVFPAKVLRYE
jgi:lipoprotein-releasing system permease protein